MKFDQAYNKLNKAQKEAVDKIEGPVMVIAGPGSGKTQVLTLRIANILKLTQTDPSNILCLTFTESGSMAMKERLKEMIGSVSYDVQVFTFHAFCQYVINTYSDYFSDISTFNVISDIDRFKIVRKILDSNRYEHLKTFNTPYYMALEIPRRLSDLKKEGVNEAEFKVMAENILDSWKEKKEVLEKGEKKILKSKILEEEKRVLKLVELADFYTKYQAELTKLKRYDFDDLINVTINTIERNEDLALSLQERYQYLLVDEYQDTNSAQNRIIDILSSYWTKEGGNPNVFVVGDDDQSIYRFQGASLENILYFKNKFPKAESILLDTNYRSTQEIIDVARSVIKNNLSQLSDIKKKFVSAKTDKGLVEKYTFETSEEESFYIAKKVEELLKSGEKASEIALLYRDNKDSADLISALNTLNIPFSIEAGENILETELIIKIINLLELINNPYDDLKFFTVASYSFLGLKTLDVLKLGYSADFILKKTNIKVKRAIFDILTNKKDQETQLSLDGLGSERDALEKFALKLVEWKTLSVNKKLSEFFATLVRDSNLLSLVLKDNKSKEGSIDVTSLNLLNSLYEEIKKFEESNPEITLESFLGDIALMREHSIAIKEKEMSLDKEKVRLMTAHRSKGLEFDHVFITKFVDKKWGGRSDRVKIKFPSNFLKLVNNEEKEASFDIDEDLKDQEKIRSLEDERRLFYVALTRARKNIYITYSKKYISYLSEKESMESKFLDEVDQKILRVGDTKKYEAEVKDLINTKLTISRYTSPELSVTENLFIDKVLSRFKLNVSALNNYLKCGYKFKLNNILSLPRAKSQVLGSVIHLTLEHFFKLFKETHKVPSESELINIFENDLKEEYLRAEEYEDIRDKGKKILSKYYENYKSLFVEPIFLEYNFGKKNVFFEDIPLSGKVDKIEVVEEATNHTEKTKVKVVDYKTMKPKTEGDILGTTKASSGEYKRQLLFYKLLAEYDRNFPYEVVSAELDFLEPDKGKFKKYEFKYTLGDIEDLKKMIRETMGSIREHKFERTKDFSECENCEYKDHCYPGGL
jgi:DNA helicase-2/ATP-dependent DNA helicase PcrA